LASPARPRVVFFGSPDFAVPCLEVCAELTEVVQVLTQPDRPAGRGLELRPPAVKVRALELGLPVSQPRKLRVASFAASLCALEADLGVVVAYGRILPRAVLEAPRLGCVNVHASLLPRWRGAAPIQRAIAAGDRESGVTLMQMDEGMDTGDILALARTPIDPDETAGALFERLSAMGAELLRTQLPRLLAGELSATPQDHALATAAPPLEKSEGLIRWDREAREVYDHLRAMSPWPGAFTYLDGRRVRIHRMRLLPPSEAALGAQAAAPGALRVQGGELHVACARGWIALDEVQEDGRRRLDAGPYIAGRRLGPQARFRDSR